MPGGNPVTDEPGETPRLPVMTLAPVLVTVEPPRTAKLCEVPRLIWANAEEGVRRNAAIPTIARRPMYVRFIECPFRKTAVVRGAFRIDFLACCSFVPFSHT